LSKILSLKVKVVNNLVRFSNSTSAVAPLITLTSTCALLNLNQQTYSNNEPKQNNNLILRASKDCKIEEVPLLSVDTPDANLTVVERRLVRRQLLFSSHLDPQAMIANRSK
jgi:hypothetical protein